MARAAREQREMAQALENQRLDAEFLAAWPQRMMALLERATASYMTIEARDGTFQVKYYDKWNDENTIILRNLDATRENTEFMAERLEWELRDREAARAESERKAALVAAAKTKLSDAEFEALKESLM